MERRLGTGEATSHRRPGGTGNACPAGIAGIARETGTALYRDFHFRDLSGMETRPAWSETRTGLPSRAGGNRTP